MNSFKGSLWIIFVSSLGLGFWYFVHCQDFIQITEGIKSEEYSWGLDSAGLLGLYFIVSVLVISAVWVLYSRLVAWICRKPFREILELDAYSYLPLILGWIQVLPFIAMVVVYTPFALVWSQSGRILLLKIMVVGVLLIKFIHLEILFHKRWESVMKLLSRIPKPYVSFIIFLVSLLVYAVIIPYQGRPEGDEPHYLLISQSIIRDHDLEINNNYVRMDYLEYMAGEMDRHVVKGRDPTLRYSTHPIGISVIMAPAYLVYGYKGVVVFFNLLSAFLAWNIFLFAFELANRKRVALIIWFLTAFSMPVSVYSSRVYPEIPTALLVIYCLRKLNLFNKINWRETLFFTVSAAYLPWIQQRCIPITALICLAVLLHFRKRPVKSLFVLICTALSFAGLLYYFYLLFGIASPSAPYIQTGFKNMLSMKIFIKQGLAGLLLDQENGLLLYAPVYIFVFAGMFLLARTDWKKTLFLLACILGFYIPAASFILKWWGSWSPVGRYMVAIIPLTIPFFVVLLNQPTSFVTKLGVALAGYLSLSISWILSHNAHFLISGENGKSKLLSISLPEVDATRYWPSFIVPSYRSYTIAFICLITMAGIAVLASRKDALLTLTTGTLQSIRARIRYFVIRYNLFFTAVVALSLVLTAFYELLPEGTASEKNSYRTYLAGLWQNVSRGVSYTAISRPSRKDAEASRELIYQIKRFSPGDYGNPHFMCSGPYITLPAGNHTIDFYLWAEKTGDVSQYGYLDVVSDRGKTVHVRTPLYAYEFDDLQNVKRFTLSLYLEKRTPNIETRIFSTKVTDMYAEKIVIGTHRNRAMEILRKGQRYEQHGYWEKAAAEYERVIAINPELREADLRRGILYGYLGQWLESEETLLSYSVYNRDNPELLYYLAKARLKNMNIGGALQDLNTAIKLNPNYFRAYELLAEAYSDAKDIVRLKHTRNILAQRFTPEKYLHCSLGQGLELYGISSPPDGTDTMILYFLCKHPMKQQYNLLLQGEDSVSICDCTPEEWKNHPTDFWIPGEMMVVSLISFRELHEKCFHLSQDSEIPLYLGLIEEEILLHPETADRQSFAHWCRIGVMENMGQNAFRFRASK